MKCSICGKEIIFRSKDDSMVLNSKTDDKFACGKCYKYKFGVDALDDISKAVAPMWHVLNTNDD